MTCHSLPAQSHRLALLRTEKIGHLPFLVRIATHKGVRVTLALMPGVAAQGVRFKATGWIVTAGRGWISGWWHNAGPFVSGRCSVNEWE